MRTPQDVAPTTKPSLRSCFWAIEGFAQSLMCLHETSSDVLARNLDFSGRDDQRLRRDDQRLRRDDQRLRRPYVRRGSASPQTFKSNRGYAPRSAFGPNQGLARTE